VVVWQVARVRAVVIALSLTAVFGLGLAAVKADPKPDAAPSFEAAYLEGKERLALAELNGKVVLVNFWASWCAPCRYEMPHFQRLYERFKPAGFEVVAIDTMDDRAKASAYLAKHRFGYHVLFDEDDKIAKAYGVIGPPQTFILDRSGAFVAIPDPKGGVARRAVFDPTIWAHPKTAVFLETLMKQK